MCDKLKFRSLFKITIEPCALLWLKLAKLLLLFVCLFDENVPNTQEAADDSASLLMRPLLLLVLLWLKFVADIFFVIAFSSSADSLELEHKLVYICLTSSNVMCFVDSGMPFSGALYRLSLPLAAMLFDRYDFNGITLIMPLPVVPTPPPPPPPPSAPAALPPPSKHCCWRFRRLLFRTYFKRPRKCFVPLFSSNDVRLETAGGIFFWISLPLIDVSPLAPAPLRFVWPGRWDAVVFELKIGRITSSGNA